MLVPGRWSFFPFLLSFSFLRGSLEEGTNGNSAMIRAPPLFKLVSGTVRACPASALLSVRVGSLLLLCKVSGVST